MAAQVTPVQATTDGWIKRDDLYEYHGVRGGKVRTCLAIAQAAVAAGCGGLVTAGARTSPQALIVARVAAALGLACRVHTPTGPLGPEVVAAQAAGAEIIQHRPGHNSVIIARARADAAARRWAEVPFGMECDEAVRQTSGQVANVPAEARRIVMPVGSGMSLAGVLHGLAAAGRRTPVLGVVVGADPQRRLAKYAPRDWRGRVTLVQAGVPYAKHLPGIEVGGVLLDSIYEAKCARFLRPGDLLWVVGIGATRATPAGP